MKTDIDNGQFVKPPCYEIKAPTDYTVFFDILTKSFPNQAYLCFEGGVHPKEFQSFIESSSVVCEIEIRKGTIWPKSKMYHLPISEKIVGIIVEWTEKLAAAELCAHLMIHDGEEVLLTWYDFPDDPFMVSSKLGEEWVETFAKKLSTSYKLYEDGL